MYLGDRPFIRISEFTAFRGFTYNRPSRQVCLAVRLHEQVMKYPLATLDQIQIANPCPVAWEHMTGDERSRHCTLCSQAVYDISVMTSQEALVLLNVRGENLCVRFYRRSDGRVMTRDCPETVSYRVSRVFRRIAVAAACWLGFAFVMGCGSGSEKKRTQGKVCFPATEPKGQEQTTKK